MMGAPGLIARICFAAASTFSSPAVEFGAHSKHMYFSITVKDDLPIRPRICSFRGPLLLLQWTNVLSVSQLHGAIAIGVAAAADSAVVDFPAAAAVLQLKTPQHQHSNQHSH